MERRIQRAWSTWSFCCIGHVALEMEGSWGEGLYQESKTLEGMHSSGVVSWVV